MLFTDTGNSSKSYIPKCLIDGAEMLFQRAKFLQLGRWNHRGDL